MIEAVECDNAAFALGVDGYGTEPIPSGISSSASRFQGLITPQSGTFLKLKQPARLFKLLNKCFCLRISSIEIDL